jgi:glycerol kinase
MASSSSSNALIAAIDAGTSSSRFLLFDVETSQVVAMKQKEIPAIRPKEGWLEEDPMIILSTVMDCIEEVCQECREKDINLKRIKGIGIANQRETTILWDKDTGRPLYNAVVWSDSRTAKLAEKMIELTPGQDKYFFQVLE